MNHSLKGPFDGRPLAFALAVAAILLAAANLRGGIVVVGPLVEDIKQGLGFNARQFSMLTTLAADLLWGDLRSGTGPDPAFCAPSAGTGSPAADHARCRPCGSPRPSC